MTARIGQRERRGPVRVAKLTGADVELGNFLVGSGRDVDSGPVASRLLLREIDGVPASRAAWDGVPYEALAAGATIAPLHAWWNPQDVGRRYLTAGGAAYIDQDHAEICLPECLSAWDHLAAWQAMLRVARAAQAAANARLPAGQRLVVWAGNSDGQSSSWGAHCSFLLTARCWGNLLEKKLHHGLVLAAHQASAIVYTGQGKVGSENRAPAVDYQLGQRADFFETLLGPQTTYRRPLLNTRDESLCGSGANGLARLHVIAFDSTLCHGATLLRVGTMQLVLALLESERIDARLILEDPVDAIRRWSHDPTLRARARLLSGAEVTAVDLQRRFCERAARFVADGACAGIVPRAEEIVALWDDTLTRLARGDVESLAGRLDWVLKRRLLDGARQRRGLRWRSPAIKHLDLIYASLDPEEGLYWECERQGLVERLVDEADVARLVTEPPEDTRAWTRAMLLRLAGRHAVAVDWDELVFEVDDGRGRRRVSVRLSDPLRFTRAELEHRCRNARTLADVLAALGAVDTGAPSATVVHVR
jgi:proteasome accessory factor A